MLFKGTTPTRLMGSASILLSVQKMHRCVTHGSTQAEKASKL